MPGKNPTQAHDRHFLRRLERQRFLLPIVQEVHAHKLQPYRLKNPLPGDRGVSADSRRGGIAGWT
jgi:hypothetical protein